MGFWRNVVIDPMLDEQTKRESAEQMAWLAREPANPEPYVNLAALYRMQNRGEEALGLLLEAARLQPDHTGANLALAEVYAIAGDYPAAWRHARMAESAGDGEGVALLKRYSVAEG
jgi:cytochrome c-type biogenesis protein CcmH/NrfG